MGEAPVRNSALVLLAIAVSAFLATFNETFLNVALTPIMQDFGISSSDVQWVSTVYMLVASVTVPVASFLYRSVPTRRLTLVALGLLFAGTVVGALSTSLPLLLVGRAVQALGTGLIVPIGMNLTLLVAPQGKLGTYMGVVSAVTLLGPAFGPIGGGVILGVADWHVLFWFFAVLVAACFVVNAVIIRDFASLSHPRLDLASVALVCVGMVGILYGISTAFSGSAAVAGVAGVVGVVCMVVFVLRQRSIDDPLLDLRPFRDPGFDTGLVVVFVAFMAVFAANITLPLFMQGSLGFSALDAALTLLAPCMLCCIFAPVAGRMFDRFGLAVTLPVALAVMALFMLLLSRSGVGVSSLTLVLLYAPILIGCSFSVGPAQSFALGRLTPELHPHGVTMCYTMIQVAGCVGSSLYVGILSAGEAAGMGAGLDAQHATATGFSWACTAAACFMAVGFLFAIATAVISRRAPKASAAASSDAALADGARSALDEVMTRDVFSISSGATAYEALQTMAARKTSGLPVVSKGGRVVGFVSDGDIMRTLSDEGGDAFGVSALYAHWSRSGTLDAALAGLKEVGVMDIATKKVVSVDCGMGLEGVCQVLSDTRIKKVPVLENSRMVGIVSRSDLIRYLVSGKAE